MTDELEDTARSVGGVELLQSILETVPTGIFVLDTSGRVVYWNSAMEGMTTLPRERAVGRDFFLGMMTSGDDQFAPFCTLYDRALETKRPVEFDAMPVITSRSGEMYLQGAIVPLLDADGEIDGLVCNVSDVTARVTAEREAGEVQERFRAVVEQSTVAIVIAGPERRVQLVNEAAVRLTGYSLEEINRADWLDLMYEDDRDRSKAIALGRRALAGQHAYDEIEIVRKDGSHAWASHAVTPVQFAGETYILAQMTDMSPRREAEAALAASERRLRDMLENMNLLGMFLDAEGRIVYANPHLSEMVGVPRQQLLGRNWFSEFVPGPRGNEIANRYAEDVRTGVFPVHNESPVMTPAGERLVSWSLTRLLDDDGEPEGIAGIGQDVTEVRDSQRALEELVGRRTAELEATNEELIEANQAKNRFLANMSHELRTPLNSVIGFTGVMLQGLSGPLTDEQTRQLGYVYSAARQLLAVISDVLDLSRIEAGHVALERTEFDPVKLVDDVVEQIRPLAEEKGLEVRAVVVEGTPSITSDRTKVWQILMNLTGNAVKFTQSGGVYLRAIAEGDEVRFSVFDTGVGIPRAEMGRIMEEFQQVDPVDGVKPQGTGLGLFIAQRFAKLLGGRIEASSRAGEGSEFAFVVPREYRPEPPPGSSD